MSGEFSRQDGIFAPDNYNQYGITIIGCGAVGSFIGINLAKLGMSKFTLYDNDKVEKHNLPNQFFKNTDINKWKVKALHREMTEYAPTKKIEIMSHPKKFNPKSKIIKNRIVYSCVDSMKSRMIIFEKALKDGVQLLIDTRMGGQIFEIYTVDLTDEKSIKRYADSLHDDKDSVQERCSERSIIYNVLVISGLAVAQLVKVLKGDNYKKEITGDLVNMMVI